MEHIHGSYDSEHRFRINIFTKAIIAESATEIVVAQYDHNSKRFIFELPKIIDEHDMMLCSAIRIHYINAGSNGKTAKDVYEVTDLKVSEEDADVVTFSWLLSRNATSLDGVLSFAIQFVCTTDGEVDYAWSTLPYKSIKVSETYDNSEDVVIEDYSDILEQWKEELFARFMEEGVNLTNYYDKTEVDDKLDEKADEYSGMPRVSLIGITTLDRRLKSDELITEDSIHLITNGVITIDFQGFVRFRMKTSYDGNNLLVDGVRVTNDTLDKLFVEYTGCVNNNIQIECRDGCDHTVEFFYGIRNVATKNAVNKLDEKFTANALKASTSGEIVRVDDVSAIKHKAVAKISSKNLLPYPYNMTSNSGNGGTFTVQDDGGIALSGTPTDYIHISLYNGVCLNKNDLITISVGGEITNVVVDFAIMDSANNVLISVSTKTHTGNRVTVNAKDYPSAAKWALTLKREYNNIEMTGVAYPKIELGDTATEYTPYVNPTTVKVKRFSKNILPYPYSQTTKEINGVTFTDNGNGSITVNGTPTQNSSITLLGVNHKRMFIPAGKTYYFHGGASAASADEFYAFLAYDNGTADTAGEISYVYDYGRTNGKAFTPVKDSYLYSAGIVVKAGYTFNNLVFKPQFEVGDKPTEFMVYTGEESYTPSSDGTVEIDSVAPTMTVFTDKSGVNIDLEYQQDHNMAMNDVRSDITGLDNSVAELAVAVGDFEAALDTAIALCDSYIGGETS